MKDIKVGDYVSYMYPHVLKNGMQTCEIKIHKVIEVEEEDFIAEDIDGKLKKYRIRHIFENGSYTEYEGYDYLKITLEEGEIDQSTYDAIKKLRYEQMEKSKLGQMDILA
jgi:hypothetical protein